MDNREQIMEAIKRVKGGELKTEGLISDGWLGSFDLLHLIKELEDVFRIKIDLDEITPAQFDSIDEIQRVLNAAIEHEGI